jgi:hypothetical protein
MFIEHIGWNGRMQGTDNNFHCWTFHPT